MPTSSMLKKTNPGCSIGFTSLKLQLGGFSFFYATLYFHFVRGEIRWKLDDQKSWMGNISPWSSGNELDIQASSSRTFPLLFVCSTYWNENQNVWRRWAGNFVWSPVMKIYAEQCWWCGGERRWIWHYIFPQTTLDPTSCWQHFQSLKNVRKPSFSFGSNKFGHKKYFKCS